MAGSGLRTNRKLTRFDLDKRVRVTMAEDTRAPVLHGRTCDISEGGMCALISGQLKAGDRVAIEIAGVEEGLFSANAIVRHARGFYYGFEFMHLDRKQAAALVKLITRSGTPKLRNKT